MDYFIISTISAIVILTLSTIFYSNSYTNSKSKPVLKVLMIICCWILFFAVLLDSFAVYPLLETHKGYVIYQNYQPDQAVEVRGFRFYNPFTHVFVKYDLTNSVDFEYNYKIQKNVRIYYQYTGTALQFHKKHVEYHMDDEKHEYHYETSKYISDILYDFARSQTAESVLDIVCFINDDLPGILPPDTRITRIVAEFP